ncbi:transcription factor Adf-1-like isoform X3 [Pectinophora gossypiella]|uniref:transcription factor Adf-1-like isoform X3 n=1 Tax=Pectinophora gossypiella TaxID=13191 RepID=UPI00214E56A7|nr:transcription factor Adf-1-like isoform X3 [Pectinophora gossypiella]
MNEIDLIKEVEKRPILYDKSVSGFNKTKLRDEAWKDVQEALNVSGNVVTTEAECKKRWRSLRDSFIKLQRTHGGRTRWPYHYAMRFLLPHVEPKSEVTIKREIDDSDAEEELRQRQIQALPDLSFPDTKYEEDDESQPSPKKARLNSVDEENPCLCNRTDPDELFLLSCAPIMKRLNSKQNAVARLKIQQVLYEAEFGHQMELPYVTPASECSFDNIEGSVG